MAHPEFTSSVVVRPLPEQSDPGNGAHAFAYTITIRNEGSEPAKLMRRHWVITYADGKVQEVHGQGVIGEQPSLAPGEHFRYTSGCVLATPVGTMKRTYQMVGEDGTRFEAEIPEFVLAIPRVLH